MRLFLALLLCLITTSASALTTAWQAAVDTSYVVAGGGSTPTYVNSNSSYTGSPITLTGVTAGHTLIACISGSTTLATTTVAGFTATTSAGSSSNFARCFYQLSASAGDLSAVITNPPSDPGWVVYEYSGITAYDTVASGDYGLTSPYTTPSITVANANSLVFMFIADETGNTGAITWTGTGVTHPVAETSHAHYAAEHLSTASGPFTSTFTGTNNLTSMLGIMMSFY